MSDRMRLKVFFKETGEILFEDQVLGNNQCFPNKILKIIGIDSKDRDEEGFFEKEIELARFIDGFKEYFDKDVFLTIDRYTWKELRTSLFMDVPSYTHIGNYAITMHALKSIQHTRTPKKIKTVLRFQ